MIPFEVYTKFIQRLNKLGTNANQNINYLMFSDLVNKAQLHWVAAQAKRPELDGDIADNIQQLLKEVSDAGVKKKNRYEIKLPDDYHSLLRVWSEPTECDGVVYGKRVEEGNLNTLLQGAFTRPSIAWEESLVTLSGGKINVYIDGVLSKTYVRYYRLPKVFEIAGFTKADGTASTDKDLEFEDVSAEEIIDLASQLAARDIGDTKRAQ